MVGLGVRLEALLLCGGALIFFGLLPVFEPIAVEMGPILNPADLGVVAMMLGMIAPLGVWKGELPHGDGQLWILPVDHTRHAQAKVLAGWVWLMVVTAVGVASLLVFTVAMSGETGTSEMRWLVTDLAAAQTGTGTGLEQTQWSIPAWLWLHPFAIVTYGYLATSAVLLCFRKPHYWIAGGWFTLLPIGVLAETGQVDSLNRALDWFSVSMDRLVLAGTESARMSITLESGERIRAWTEFITFESWVAGFLPWLLGAMAITWVGTHRSRLS